MLFLCLFALILLSLAQGHKPEQIHVTLSGNPQEYIISFVTFGELLPSTTSIVEYGLKGNLNQKSTAIPSKFTERRCGSERIMHDIAISFSSPGEQISFRVGVEGFPFSEIFLLSTLSGDYSSKEMKFSIFGDLASIQNCPNVPNSITLLTQESQKRTLDFVIHAGDIAYNLDDECGKIGDRFMNEIQPIATRVPYVFGPGNHETDILMTYANYKARYSGQEALGKRSGSNSTRFYSFNAGLVHFLSIDTDAYVYPTVTLELLKEMYEFAKDDLERVDRKKTPWIIVYGHRAMYCTYSGNRRECGAEATSIRKGTLLNLEPRFGGMEELLVKHGVELYVAGHTHHYERSYPVIDKKVVSTSYQNPKAPVHVLSGIAGPCGDNYFTDEQESWQAFRDLDYHISYSKIVVHNETTLSFQQIRADDGTVIDSFDLIHQTHGPF